MDGVLGGLTVTLALPVRGFYGRPKPRFAISVVDANLHPDRKCRKNQAEHVRCFHRVVLPIFQESFDFFLRDLIGHMRERARLRALLEELEVLENLIIAGKNACQRCCGVVANRDHLEWITQALDWVDVLSFRYSVGQRVAANLEACKLIFVSLKLLHLFDVELTSETILASPGVPK